MKNLRIHGRKVEVSGIPSELLAALNELPMAELLALAIEIPLIIERKNRENPTPGLTTTDLNAHVRDA